MALIIHKESQTFLTSDGKARYRRISNLGSDGRLLVYWSSRNEKKQIWEEIIDPKQIKKLEDQREKAEAEAEKKRSKN